MIPAKRATDSTFYPRTKAETFLYAPFGEITTEYNINFGNNVIPKYSFNAKELDEETGFYYYEARYYNPPTFTSRDPLFEKYFWMSPYAYCANNPVKYVDPDGREKLIWLNKDKDKTIISGANNYKDDGAIHIFAHGNSQFMTVKIDGEKQDVTNSRQLEELLSKYSEVWKNKKDGDNITIVLHSCRTGEGDNSFAQKVSKDLGVTVIAPDQRDYFSEYGEIGTYKAKYTDKNNNYLRNNNGGIKSKERSNEMGNWRVFKNGEEKGSYKGSWKPKEKPTLWDNIFEKK